MKEGRGGIEELTLVIKELLGKGRLSFIFIYMFEIMCECDFPKGRNIRNG